MTSYERDLKRLHQQIKDTYSAERLDELSRVTTIGKDFLRIEFAQYDNWRRDPKTGTWVKEP